MDVCFYDEWDFRMLGHVSFFQENQWIFRPSPPTCVNPDNLDTTNTIVCIIPFISFYVFWWVYHPKCEFFRYPCLQQQRKTCELPQQQKTWTQARCFLFCSGELMVRTTLHPGKLTRSNSFNKNGQQKMLEQTAAKQLVTLRRNRTHWFHLTSASAYGRSGHAWRWSFINFRKRIEMLFVCRAGVLLFDYLFFSIVLCKSAWRDPAPVSNNWNFVKKWNMYVNHKGYYMYVIYIT